MEGEIIEAEKMMNCVVLQANSQVSCRVKCCHFLLLLSWFLVLVCLFVSKVRRDRGKKKIDREKKRSCVIFSGLYSNGELAALFFPLDLVTIKKQKPDVIVC